jgi:quinohemoprotein ethanol dehydrogenase
VIVGVSGGDRPTRGFFDAYEATTGRRAWRFYTVPGDPSQGFENAAMRKAAETWDNQWWTRGGGGAVWDGMAYDPEAELVYVGTGNADPGPSTSAHRRRRRTTCTSRRSSRWT